MNKYTVALLFDNRDRHSMLLVLKDRTCFKGKFNGIGGKVEEGELPNVAAFREIREETGATSYPLTLLGERYTSDETGKVDATAECRLYFYCGLVDPNTVTQQPGESELLAWIPVSTVMSHPEFFPDDGMFQEMCRKAYAAVNNLPEDTQIPIHPIRRK